MGFDARAEDRAHHFFIRLCGTDESVPFQDAGPLALDPWPSPLDAGPWTLCLTPDP